MAASMVAMLFTGCGKTESNTTPASEPAAVESTADDETPKAEVPAQPYFTKGVYLNTEEGQAESDRKYYYVFNNETEGHTDGGVSGLPFVCEQRDNGVWFSFGGADPESEDFLTIESAENGIIKGHF